MKIFTNNLKTIDNRGLAFTLAEVLITLGIIGVVAALTIPTLVNNYQNAQYSTSIKKAYTQMNQVLLQMANENGTPDSIADYFYDPQVACDAIASHYKIAKNCQFAVGSNCFAKYNANFNGSSVINSDMDNSASYYKFTTVDGTAFSILTSWNNHCSTNNGFDAAPDSPTYYAVCGTVVIDTNGLKGPNYLGRDLFQFYITSKKIPMLYQTGGWYDTTSNYGYSGTAEAGGGAYWNSSGANRCSKNSPSGIYCTGRLIEKNWNIDY